MKLGLVCVHQKEVKELGVRFLRCGEMMWVVRNQHFFKDSEVNTAQVIDTVILRIASRDLITSMIQKLKDLCVETKLVKKTKLKKWIPSTSEVLIFNVDGSTRGKPSLTGIGGVLRDCKGKVLCLFYLHVGILESNSVEILAIHKACQLCSSKPFLVGCDTIIVSDSKMAVSWINKEGFIYLNHINTIYDIQNVLDLLVGTVMIYNSRAINAFMDNLAKMRSNMCGDLVEWGNC